mmetsp:Transcript_27926/g.56290  ORF Transcript_27926/g.56290 Transcript_27926/m.56290 type:complete len:137 (+) Transcript_27926:1502-1912(+)
MRRKGFKNKTGVGVVVLGKKRGGGKGGACSPPPAPPSLPAKPNKRLSVTTLSNSPWGTSENLKGPRGGTRTLSGCAARGGADTGSEGNSEVQRTTARWMGVGVWVVSVRCLNPVSRFKSRTLLCFLRFKGVKGCRG